MSQEPSCFNLSTACVFRPMRSAAILAVFSEVSAPTPGIFSWTSCPLLSACGGRPGEKIMSLVFLTARRIEAMMSGVAMKAPASGCFGGCCWLASISASPLPGLEISYSPPRQDFHGSRVGRQSIGCDGWAGSGELNSISNSTGSPSASGQGLAGGCLSSNSSTSGPCETSALTLSAREAHDFTRQNLKQRYYGL